jgi:Permuted papain-like amidase enzyme, YaeF/YiiX, C92 family
MKASMFSWPLIRLKQWLKQAVARRLNREVTGYDIKVLNNMERLYKHIRKGDVVLVEEMVRISQFIKYTTQSPWSHCALYVGDELLRRGGRLREQALATFGEFADHLLIEALTDKGVVVTPLAKYRWHNIRICRPFKIDSADLDRVIDSTIADLGKEYDNRNFLELALLLLCPVKFGSMKTWTIQTCLGNCTEHQVICSGMIAQAFQRVGYPILPVVDIGDPPDEKLLEAPPYSYPLTMRHYSQILPRDFDLSPNFQIIKFNIIEEGDFDYNHLNWNTISHSNPTSVSADLCR